MTHKTQEIAILMITILSQKGIKIMNTKERQIGQTLGGSQMQNLFVFKMCYLPIILIFVLFSVLQKNRTNRMYLSPPIYHLCIYHLWRFIIRIGSCNYGGQFWHVWSLKSVRQGSRMITQAGFLYCSLEKNSFYFGKPQSLLLRPSTD